MKSPESDHAADLRTAAALAGTARRDRRSAFEDPDVPEIPAAGDLYWCRRVGPVRPPEMSRQEFAHRSLVSLEVRG